jgi:hypothetical protein
MRYDLIAITESAVESAKIYKRRKFANIIPSGYSYKQTFGFLWKKVFTFIPSFHTKFAATFFTDCSHIAFTIKTINAPSRVSEERHPIFTSFPLSKVCYNFSFGSTLKINNF